MNFKRIISVVDSHTAGEPTRIIVDGFGLVLYDIATGLLVYNAAVQKSLGTILVL